MQGSYTLRESGLRAQIRHPLLDMWVLEELFRFGAYEPPRQVGETLDLLGRPPRILDLGGHVGLFGLFAFGRFDGVSVVSFEPDPRNAQVLRRCIEANALGERWRLVEACAGTGEGTVEFDSAFHLSGVARGGRELAGKRDEISAAFPFMAGAPLLSPERHVVAVQDVLPAAMDVDLLKIDIEGGEWEILSDPRFKATAAVALVLEYHATENEGSGACARAHELLGGAGFQTRQAAQDGDAGVIWAWRDTPAAPQS